MAEPTRPEARTDDRAGVEGGERDVGTDGGAPAEATSQGGMRGEEARDARGGGMAGEG